jgi:hypothetical protein
VEAGAAGAGLRSYGGLAVRFQRHASAGLEGFDELIHGLRARDCPAGAPWHVIGTDRVDQHRIVAGWEEVAAFLGGGGRVFNADEPSRSLLFEPFPSVAFRSLSRSGEGRRGDGTGLPQGAVVAQALTEMDRLQLNRRDGRGEEAFGQRIRGGRGVTRGWGGAGCGGHELPSFAGMENISLNQITQRPEDTRRLADRNSLRAEGGRGGH